MTFVWLGKMVGIHVAVGVGVDVGVTVGAKPQPAVAKTTMTIMVIYKMVLPLDDLDFMCGLLFFWF